MEAAAAAAGIENFSVRMMLVGAKKCCTDPLCPNSSFITGEEEKNCQIVNDKELKALVGPELEDDIDLLSYDVMAVCLLTFQKVTIDQFKKLKEDINNRQGHYKFDGNKMLLFCNLKEGIKA